MEISESAIRGQVDRVVHSEIFRLSELQRRLLLYLTEKSLSGEADQLKEYTIAVDAFGKPESYDPRRDATVRLQTGKLRQKLLEYYQTTGQSDPVLIDFPKGHFKLFFSTREASAPPVAMPMPAKKSGSMVKVGLGGLAVVLGGMCVYLSFRVNQLEKRAELSADTWTPALEEFWSPFLDRKVPAMICVGAPLFFRLQNAGFLRDSEVNNLNDAERTGFLKNMKRLFPGETPVPWTTFTGVGEAGGAFLIGNLLATRDTSLRFADSSQLTWNEIGQSNVVFVGPPKFISQISELPAVQDLVIESAGIRNLKPRAGEPVFLQDEYIDAQHQNGQTHALISRLPGLHGKGQILVVGGTWTEGTYAACQYVTLEPHVREMLNAIRLPGGKLPPYFQLVVSATIRRSTPVKVSYLSHHVLTPTGRAAQ